MVIGSYVRTCNRCTLGVTYVRMYNMKLERYVHTYMHP